MSSLPNPNFEAYFKNNVPTMGYAYAVACNGTYLCSGASGYAQDPSDANIPFSTDSRIHLASVSKSVTAAAMIKFLDQEKISIKETFLGYIQKQLLIADPDFKPGPGVEQVTFLQLLTMTAPLTADGALNGDLWSFLATYLAQPVIDTTPYSNTNFTILQAVIEAKQSLTYVEWVSQYILRPMSIDTSFFTPEVYPTDALAYVGSNQGWKGHAFESFEFVAPGGWVATANQILLFLMGLRNTKPLSSSQIDQLFTPVTGSGHTPGFYQGESIFGNYYHHNGGLAHGTSNGVAYIHTGIIRFPLGYDLILLCNSNFAHIISVMAEAFQSTPLSSGAQISINAPGVGYWQVGAAPNYQVTFAATPVQGTTFTVIIQDNKICFQASNGKYLQISRISNQSFICANASKIGSSSQFQLIANGQGLVSLAGDNKAYLSVVSTNKGNFLEASGSQITENALFSIALAADYIE
jgi:CubicO group peptidase (beta-lactamase class C family)